ncbi:MAG: [FeFe] hydrogenase H-cluster radical SAM maturase HydE [Syntrophomonadaceae bacterium]|jgi:biotin synthase
MSKPWSEKEITGILADPDPKLLDELLQAADSCRRENIGTGVYLRGLIEFSNICSCNCYYCGIRKDNKNLHRYRLSSEEMVSLAMSAFDSGFHSLALQSGEVRSCREVSDLASTIRIIKEKSRKKDQTGQGLGITLSVGNLTSEQYQELWEAGAHRYLLRIETSDPKLFSCIHPPEQSFDERLRCLDDLKRIGYQVGTGVMIGLPGQTVAQLAADLRFFVDRDIDMLGMGPYITHPDTPLAKKPAADFDPFTTSLKMIAIARLLMPDINIVASTALQTISPRGLELGLKAGANVLMPIMTPDDKRSEYSLYTDKKFTPHEQLIEQIRGYGYEVGLWTWGDSKHYAARKRLE